MPKSLCYIPDPQAKPGQPDDHAEWLANYLLDKQPDYLVCAGDLYDMPSCSNHKTAMQSEGASVREDLEAGHHWLERFDGPINKYNRRRKKHNQYRPKKIVTLGNHEMQIARIASNDPRFRGEYGMHSFAFKEYGWKTYPFLVPVNIQDVWFSHYWANPLSSRPIGGSAEYKLSKLCFSFAMGHVQTLQVARRDLQNGQTITGLVAGAFYPWNEGYKGPQGNNHFRGIVFMNDLRCGSYDVMPISLDYLRRQWS